MFNSNLAKKEGNSQTEFEWRDGKNYLSHINSTEINGREAQLARTNDLFPVIYVNAKYLKIPLQKSRD